MFRRQLPLINNRFRNYFHPVASTNNKFVHLIHTLNQGLKDGVMPLIYILLLWGSKNTPYNCCPLSCYLVIFLSFFYNFFYEKKILLEKTKREQQREKNHGMRYPKQTKGKRRGENPKKKKAKKPKNLILS